MWRKLLLIGLVLSLTFSMMFGQITIDGEVADWTPEMQLDVSPNLDELAGDVTSGADITNVWVTNDADNLYFRFDVAAGGDLSTRGETYIYIDTDQSATTGLTWGWWTTGGDWMLELGASTGATAVYQHTHADNGWSWAWVSGDAFSAISTDGLSMEISLPRATLGTDLGAAFNMMLLAKDAAAVEDTYPGYGDTPATFALITLPDPGPHVPVDFEIAGNGADWDWIVAENGTNPALEIIANPMSGGINTSSTVAKFTAELAGQPWALFHSDGIGEFTFDATNSTVKMMVNKPVISNVGLKFEGAGPVLELTVPNTLINEWEELTFDFSSLIGNTYNKIVVIPDFDFTPRAQDNIVYLDNVTLSEQIIIPDPGPYAPVDFEADGHGADWTWIVAEDGTNPALEIIANPVSGGINTSATVAKFTAEQAGQPWALFHSDGIGMFTFDATNSTVKIMVNKPVISNVGLKFEGPGTALELQLPNTMTDEWEELTFDFSGEIGNAFNKIVIIPDFTARAQDNIMYVDNIAFSDQPVGPVPGLFFSEYAEGSVGNNKYVEIYNPTDADVDLTPYSVQGSNNGSAWGAGGNRDVSLSGTLAAGDVYVIAADQANADILAQTDLALPYESPVHHNGNDGIALLKDGLIIDAIGVENVDPGVAWDVAGVVEATKDHTLIRKNEVMFGNLGDWAMSAGTDAVNSQWITADEPTADYTPPTLGWHIDPPVIVGPNVPVDFEAEGNGADWEWIVAENGANPALQVIANPVSGGMNTSATVGEFTALQAGQPWALLHSGGIGEFTFDATNSTVKIMVYKPTISNVGLKFEGAGPVLEIQIPNTVMNEWEELTFDFSSLIGNVYNRIVIIPDFEARAQDNTLYFDNIAFSEQIIIPDPGPYAPVDFEVAGNGADWNWIVGENGTNPALEILANPMSGGINTSATVAKFTAELAGQPWALFHSEGIGVFTFDATNSTVKMMVNKPVISNVGLKFEGVGPVLELTVPNTLINEWEELTFDFSSLIGNTYNRIVIIPDFDFTPRAQENIVYLDNVTFSEQIIIPDPGPYAPVDFEVAGNGADWDWIVAEDGTNPALEILANPMSGGINTSATVAKFTAELAGQPWALFHSDGIGVFTFDATNSTVKMMVNKPVISNVGLKFEGVGPVLELTVPNTLINEWEELTFDFSSLIGNTYNRIVIIPDFDFTPRAQENIVYLDNVTFSEQIVIVEPLDIAGTWVVAPEAAALMVGPNPNDGSWWSNSADDVTTRACFFDDQFVFNEDGSFANVMDGNTWLETWQGVEAEGCGTPIAPHDGSNAATYTSDAGSGTITLNGVGAHLGIPKVYNGGELSNPADAPASITYEVTLSDNNETMTLVISIGGGYWTFKLVKFDPTYVVDNVVPDNFALKQNYPNPFNPSTTIRYSLIESGQVVLKLFNIRGQEVATLVNAMASPGEYAYYLDASDLAAGTYLYAITAGNQTIVKKMVLIK